MLASFEFANEKDNPTRNAIIKYRHPAGVKGSTGLKGYFRTCRATGFSLFV
jgi:hypothetical protein